MLSTQELAFKQTQDMLKIIPESYAALSWSKNQLKAVRNLRLRKLLHYVKANSPWYQKHLANINLDYFTEEHLIDIPSMDKVTLMENWDEIVTDRRLSLALVEQHIEKMKDDGDTLYLLDCYHVLATSGSSGKRGIYIYNWDEWINFYLFNIRYNLRRPAHHITPTDPEKKWISAIVVVSNSVFALYSISKTFTHDKVEEVHIPITLPTEQIVIELNRIQPNSLVGTPSTISRLCHEPFLKQLTIQPQVILVCGEPLFGPIRTLIQTAWPNARINNVYGSSEGLFGINCHANDTSYHMHLNDDGCIAQPVDIMGNPVGAGVTSHKLYLTNLYLYTLPLIRYEFSDQLHFLDKTCECGVNHQLIAEPPGRPEFDFLYQGHIFVHHLIFVTPLLLEKNIHEYQVIQNERGANIKIISGGYIDKNSLGNTICNSLSALGLKDPQVTFSEVTKFEYTPSGKLRRFIKCDNPNP